MKAIFTNFGRRANTDRRQAPETSPSKPTVAFPGSHAPRFRTTYSSSTSASGGIGDAPSPANQCAVDNSWPSNSSSRGPSRPPSSYRKPSGHASSAGGLARGLVRKISIAGRRDLPQAQHEASTDPSLVSHSDSLGSKSSLSGGALHSNGASASALRQRYDASSAGNDVAKADISVMTSTELAARLNELAVANADGLLTEDEYRLLRQAVFDQMMRAEARSMSTSADRATPVLRLAVPDQAVKSVVTGDSPSSSAQLSTDLLRVGRGRSGSSLGHGDQSASSICSGRSGNPSSFQNVTLLSQNQATTSKAMQAQSSQDSHFTQDTSHRGALGRIRPARRNSEGVSSRLSSGDGYSQHASSIHTQQSSAVKSSRLSTFGLLRTSSQARRERALDSARDMEEAFSAERTSQSLRAVSLYDAASINVAYDKSLSQLRAEDAPSSLFGAEYADKSSREIRAEINVVQGEGNRMLSTFAAFEETLVSKQTVLELSALKEVVDWVRASNPTACVCSLEMSEPVSHGRRLSRPPPPSSYRTPRTALVSSAPFSSDELPADVTAFEAELSGIYAQKAAVVKRYQDRLAFLQSKLRSALIREGLK